MYPTSHLHPQEEYHKPIRRLFPYHDEVVADGDDGERGLSENAHSEDEDTHSEDEDAHSEYEDDHSEQETLLYSIEDNGKIFRSVVSCQNIEKQPLSQKYVVFYSNRRRTTPYHY
ncbi:hypothetical protein EDC94DRAFT_589509 [Helicostylum pulchrum]|nr:hypothetical protein EDC94DRAFT_589509 [Helicostylum pulchrum]